MEDSVNSSGNQDGISTPVAMDSKWTNKKHCLFLKSMESTFVNQLFKSIDKYGCHSRQNCLFGSKSSNNRLASIRSSPGQFKVIRGGCISKMGFGRDEPEGDQEEESKVSVTASPWIRRYRNSQARSLATTENQNPMYHFRLARQDSTGSNAEVTDQNFNDEASEGEKPVSTHDQEKK